MAFTYIIDASVFFVVFLQVSSVTFISDIIGDNFTNKLAQASLNNTSSIFTITYYFPKIDVGDYYGIVIVNM